MPLTIEERTESDVTILSPDGRLDAASLQQFSGMIQQVIEQGAKKLLIDFSKTEYMSSAGVRAIIEGMNKVQQAKGEMAVCAPNEHLQELFDVIRLDQLVKVYSTEFEALDKML